MAKDMEEGLAEVADALDGIALQLKYLGNGNAGTQMGAIEGLAVQLKEGLLAIAEGLHAVAHAIEDGSEQ
jgi:hypothetical protein